MTDYDTIKRWTEYAQDAGVESAITKLWGFIDQERQRVNHWHNLFAEKRDTLHTVTYVQGDADTLRAVADEIDCGAYCDCAHREYDTGATVCSREEEPGIGCRGLAASSLREMARALDQLAAHREAARANGPRVAPLSGNIRLDEPTSTDGETP